MTCADFPASAVDTGLEFQAAYHLAGGFFRVDVAHLHWLAIEIVCDDGVDYRAYDAFGLAQCFQLFGHFLALGDEREILANQARKQRDLVIGKMRLTGMQRPPNWRAVFLEGDGRSEE